MTSKIVAGPKRGHFSRSRSLVDFNKKFGKYIVQKTIQKALSQQKNVRVLEIGCGEGRVLMELRKLFPDIELHGINRKPWAAMQGQRSLPKTARHYGIFTPSELKKISLPQIHFYDAQELKFPKNYFDLVISQVSIQYVARKDLLLQEVWRTLKLGGKALLNIDARAGEIPDFLDFATPRFIIYKKSKIYPVKKLIQKLRKDGFDLRYASSTEKEEEKVKQRVHVLITKNSAKPLKLGLHFDDLSSFNLNVLNEEKNNWSVFWGYRSVYRC
ncbi:methyltransferase domain-containing protein [Candidatus Woesearchaeota archaeon]|nr:methyltransferase domain-containing protein [Candidatus Woesearchaeota archaeon]